MQTFFHPKTTQRVFLALLTTVLCATATLAQNDEQQIRNLIKTENDGGGAPKVTNDVFYWPGIIDSPVVGKQNWEAKSKELRQARPNTKFNRVPERLVVSESKDLAYEYGYQTTGWDKPEGGRAETKGYYLRVWRKVNGEWLLEGFFARLTEQK
ncbi:MAG: YybH family protein [Saprospiraceae bacterium]